MRGKESGGDFHQRLKQRIHPRPKTIRYFRGLPEYWPKSGETTRMPSERTELEWIYRPEDFFEVAYKFAGSGYDLLIENGRAVATLTIPQDPVDPRLEAEILAILNGIFL